MTVRQLRPDQKKLWRRIYLQSMDRGDGAEKAAKEADLTVTQWEARNAFDETTAGFASPFSVAIPFPLEAVRVTLARRALLDDVATAVHPSAATCILIALTERGYAICMAVRTNGWATMMREISVVDDEHGRGNDSLA